MLNSAVLATWLWPSTCVIPVVAGEVGATYNQRVQEIGCKHKLGNPHIHIAVGVFAALGKATELALTAREFWAGLAAGLQKKGQMTVAHCIQICKGGARPARAGWRKRTRSWPTATAS